LSFIYYASDHLHNTSKHDNNFLTFIYYSSDHLHNTSKHDNNVLTFIYYASDHLHNTSKHDNNFLIFFLPYFDFCIVGYADDSNTDERANICTFHCSAVGCTNSDSFGHADYSCTIRIAHRRTHCIAYRKTVVNPDAPPHHYASNLSTIQTTIAAADGATIKTTVVTAEQAADGTAYFSANYSATWPSYWPADAAAILATFASTHGTTQWSANSTAGIFPDGTTFSAAFPSAYIIPYDPAD
jgi:hypothetical protein